MKSVFFFLLMFLTTLAWSAEDWKVVAETTTRCKDKFQVLAKEGEKFVYIIDGSSKKKLIAEEGAIYSSQNPKAVTFSNPKNNPQNDNAKRFIFNQPSMVDANPPKLDISMNNQSEKCKMSLK